jgi:hypothetical protein
MPSPSSAAATPAVGSSAARPAPGSPAPGATGCSRPAACCARRRARPAVQHRRRRRVACCRRPPAPRAARRRGRPARPRRPPVRSRRVVPSHPLHQVVAREALEVARVPITGCASRVRAPAALVEQLEGGGQRVVLVFGEFVQQHLALAREFVAGEGRRQHQVGQHRRNSPRVLRQPAHVERGVVLVGVRVDLGAQPFGVEVDAPRIARGRALEHHVLDRVADAGAMPGMASTTTRTPLASVVTVVPGSSIWRMFRTPPPSRCCAGRSRRSPLGWRSSAPAWPTDVPIAQRLDLVPHARYRRWMPAMSFKLSLAMPQVRPSSQRGISMAACGAMPKR